MRVKTTKEFIKRAKEVHGNRYSYEKVKYVNRRTKVIIICSKHGDFSQGPYIKKLLKKNTILYFPVIKL